jgi:hypothetical protein
MKIHIEFDTDNEAFNSNIAGEGATLQECAKIFNTCKGFISCHLDSYSGNSIRGLFDSNGNRIGQLEIDDTNPVSQVELDELDAILNAED